MAYVSGYLADVNFDLEGVEEEMTEETRLVYDANHVYREGYDQGVKDTMDFKEDYMHERMGDAVGQFIIECGEMAEENWCDSQIEMLRRLFGAVLEGTDYDKWEPKDETEVQGDIPEDN